MSFLNELKRRNVLRVATAYIVGSWLLIQVSETIFPLFGYGDTPARLIVIVLTIAFIPSLIFAWVFEITPEGLKRDADVVRDQSITQVTGKKLDRIILVVLALALAYFAFDKFVLEPARDQSKVEIARQEGRTEALVESYGEKSIAVLPFVDMSNNKDQEYMSDGIAEELLNLLAKIPELRVISRSSAFSYKGKDIKLADVARELNVNYILEGSVRKSGNQLRITAQLIEAHSDTHLWSETYDRTLDDIFSIQDEIALEIVRNLNLILASPTPNVERTNPEAYAMLLRARSIAKQYSDESLKQASELLKQVLSLDPLYGPAWALLSNTYANGSGIVWSREEAYALSNNAAMEALPLLKNPSTVYAQLGWNLMADEGDLVNAAHQYQRALKLDSKNPFTVGTAAVLAKALGRLELAISMQKIATLGDPVNPIQHHNLAYSYLESGQLDEAEASFQATLQLAPRFLGANYGLSLVLLKKGKVQEALSAIKAETSEPAQLTGLSIIYHVLGQQTEFEVALAELINKHEQECAYNIAYVLAYRGEADRAFEWLDKAVEYKDTGLLEITLQPLLANIHDDPRWLPFLESIGRSPEQLAAIEFKVTLPE